MDLEELVLLVKDSDTDLPDSLVAVAWLTPWAVDFRYEEPQSALDVRGAEGSASAAIELAERVLAGR